MLSFPPSQHISYVYIYTHFPSRFIFSITKLYRGYVIGDKGRKTGRRSGIQAPRYNLSNIFHPFPRISRGILSAEYVRRGRMSAYPPAMRLKRDKAAEFQSERMRRVCVRDVGSDRIGSDGGGADVRPSRENSCELLTLSENTASWNSLIFTRVVSIFGNWPGNERGEAERISLFSVVLP